MSVTRAYGYSDVEARNFLHKNRKRKGLKNSEWLELLHELCGQAIETRQGKIHAKQKFERLKREWV